MKEDRMTPVQCWCFLTVFSLIILVAFVVIPTEPWWLGVLERGFVSILCGTFIVTIMGELRRYRKETLRVAACKAVAEDEKRRARFSKTDPDALTPGVSYLYSGAGESTRVTYSGAVHLGLGSETPTYLFILKPSGPVSLGASHTMLLSSWQVKQYIMPEETEDSGAW